MNLVKNKYLPSIADIRNLEILIGNSLPDDYIKYMITYNDFMPSPPKAYCFKINWEDKLGAAPFNEASIGSWEIINPSNQEESIAQSIANLWEPNAEFIPPELIPIGGDAGGGLILLNISKINHGAIYYWFDGSPYEPGEPSYDNIGFVTNSFTEFLESLYPCEE